MALFFAYLYSLAGHWLDGYWVLTAVPEVLSYLLPEKWTERLDSKIKRESRRKIALILALAGVFLAGFQTWHEEYEADQAATKEQNALSGRPEEPNKYICISNIPPLFGSNAKHAVLIEFGVHRESTDGALAGVQTAQKYSSAYDWTGPPLRTDRPITGDVFFNSYQNRSNPNVYTVGFSGPSITPRHSLYFYLEGNEPLVVVRTDFVEDFAARSDQTRLQELAQEPIAKCPR
jgi:hypothetical protein